MLFLRFSSRFFVLVVLVSGVLCSLHTAEVFTTTGSIRGERRVLDGRTYRVFLGIPYAQPPVGELRFRAPVPKDPLEGTLNAVQYGPSCPQNISDVSRYYPDYVVRIPKSAREISEDCLTLNIFSPVDGESRNERKAVMFWLHGGSFETGQGSGYDASALAVRGGVVVVTINYRLNVFGLLSTNDKNSPGNYGLLDQQLALQWVHDNIAAFGGDPARVTLFGQSAGGVAVMSHLTAPRSRPLFQRVIAQSGISGGSAGIFSTGRQQRQYAKRIALKAGCSHRGRPMVNTQNLVTCLRDKPTHVVLRAGLEVAKEEIIPRVWLPVIDENFYPVYSALTSSTFDQFDIVVGVTSDDGSPLLELLPDIINKHVNQSNGLSQADFEAIFPVFLLGRMPYTSLTLRAINFEYRDWTEPCRYLDRLKKATDFMLDSNFLLGINFYMGGMYRGAKSRRMYVFDHRSTPHVKYPWLAGAPHSEELSYVFGLPFNGSGIGHLFTDQERTLSDRMIAYWSNIAKSG